MTKILPQNQVIQQSSVDEVEKLADELSDDVDTDALRVQQLKIELKSVHYHSCVVPLVSVLPTCDFRV